MFDGDVVKSDSAIPTSLKEALQVAAVELEDVPDAHQDWHPGSVCRRTVLDLVHPSLFPVVFGVTRILKRLSASSGRLYKEMWGRRSIESVPPAEEAQILKPRVERAHSPLSGPV